MLPSMGQYLAINWLLDTPTQLRNLYFSGERLYFVKLHSLCCKINTIIRKQLRQRKVILFTAESNRECDAARNRSRCFRLQLLNHIEIPGKDKRLEPVIAKLNTLVSSKSP